MLLMSLTLKEELTQCLMELLWTSLPSHPKFYNLVKKKKKNLSWCYSLKQLLISRRQLWKWMLIATLLKAAVGLIICLITACWCDIYIDCCLTDIKDRGQLKCKPCSVASTLLLLRTVRVHSKRGKKNAFQPKYFIAFMKRYIRC